MAQKRLPAKGKVAVTAEREGAHLIERWGGCEGKVKGAASACRLARTQALNERNSKEQKKGQSRQLKAK